jgi:hypothetical protein
MKSIRDLVNIINEAQQTLNEAAPGLDTIGVPPQLSGPLMKAAPLSFDEQPVPVVGKALPGRDSLKRNVLIRKSSGGWHVLWYGINDRWWPTYTVMSFVDGEFETATSKHFKDIKHLFGSGSSQYWNLPMNDDVADERGSSHRGTKEKAKQLGASDPLGDKSDDTAILKYANKVFLPKLKPQLEKIANDLKIRLEAMDDLDHELPSAYQHKFHRPEEKPPHSLKTLGEAFLEELEDTIDNGFSHNSLAYLSSQADPDMTFLSAQYEANGEDRVIRDWMKDSFDYKLENALLLVKTPNGRARLAQTYMKRAQPLIKRLEAFIR